jgi:hypothetical protein
MVFSGNSRSNFMGKRNALHPCTNAIEQMHNVATGHEIAGSVTELQELID